MAHDANDDQLHIQVQVRRCNTQMRARKKKIYNLEFDAMPWRYVGGTENRIRCGGNASVVRLQRAS